MCSQSLKREKTKKFIKWTIQRISYFNRLVDLTVSALPYLLLSVWGGHETERENMIFILPKHHQWRNQEAKAIRGLRKICEQSKAIIKPYAYRLMICIGLALLMFIFSCTHSKPAHAKDYSNEEILKAIYLAEGGKKAQYPYGIRSINCATESECRRICLNTIRNNRVRFAKYGHKNHPDFISFLGSRYCPTNGTALSANERKLNKHWIKNVRYFLEVA